MKSSSNSTSPSEARGWTGRLELDIATPREGAPSTIVSRRHEGPLVVQRPFHPERDGTCHVLVVHPPGGLVSGDSLTLQARVQGGARALLTTPAATKLYRARRGAGPAQQRVVLALEPRAELEYLPQETIAFDGSEARLSTEVELAAGACFMGWEVVCLGRPAAGERFARGSLALSIHVRRAGRSRLFERLAVTGSGLLDGPAGLRGEPVVGTFVVVPRDASHEDDDPAALHAHALADAARAALAGPALRGLSAVTSRGEMMIARYLGPSAEEARSTFECIWRALRPLVLDKPAVAPRIWRT
jgi:urease accessory protein